MEWLEIAKAIGELGILIVIAGLFLYFSYKNNKAQSEMTNKIFENLLEQMKVCAGGHVLTEEEDKTAIKIDNAIQILIQKAVGDLQCGRIMVVRYHNGGKDMNLPKEKIGMVANVIIDGIIMEENLVNI